MRTIISLGKKWIVLELIVFITFLLLSGCKVVSPETTQLCCYVPTDYDLYMTVEDAEGRDLLSDGLADKIESTMKVYYEREGEWHFSRNQNESYSIVDYFNSPVERQHSLKLSIVDPTKSRGGFDPELETPYRIKLVWDESNENIIEATYTLDENGFYAFSCLKLDDQDCVDTSNGPYQKPILMVVIDQ